VDIDRLNGFAGVVRGYPPAPRAFGDEQDGADAQQPNADLTHPAAEGLIFAFLFLQSFRHGAAIRAMHLLGDLVEVLIHPACHKLSPIAFVGLVGFIEALDLLT
jgi:hypothetical protein